MHQFTRQDFEELRPSKEFIMSEYKKMKPHYDFDKYDYIDSWETYSEASTKEEGVLWTQLQDYILNGFQYLDGSDRHPSQCSHQLFATKSEFFDKFSAAICHTGGANSSVTRKQKLLQFQKTIRNTDIVSTTNDNNPQIDIKGKFGLCNECRILFILKHNGFKKWIRFYYKLHLKSPLYRCFGLMLFSQCVCNQPIILKSLLIKNVDNYSLLFKMFFNMLEIISKVEMTDFINENIVRFFKDKDFNPISFTSCDFDYEYCMNNIQLEVLLRYEKNLATVLSVIKPLSRYFGLEHVRLFIKHGFPLVFHNFLINFSKSPHLIKHCQALIQKFTLSMASSEDRESNCGFALYQFRLPCKSIVLFLYHPFNTIYIRVIERMIQKRMTLLQQVSFRNV